MPRQLTFQDPGEGIHEGEIVEVLVSAGDEVAEGDDVVTVETDKATEQVPSPFSGTVANVEVSAGDVVTVGDPMITFDDADADADADADGEGAEPEAEPEEAEEADDSGARAVGELPGPAPRRERRQERRRERQPEDEGGGGPAPASPATRRLARELGVDLAGVEGSGPGGRATADDVRAAAEGGAEEQGAPRPESTDVEEAEGRPPSAPPEAGRRPQLPDLERFGPVERVPLRGVRRAIADRMATSWSQIPHVTHHDVADITDLERFRREEAGRVEEAGGQLSLTVLVMKALSGVLARHPRFNASLDADAGELVLRRSHHIGVAVDTDDGLIVPVVRDVDRTPLVDLAVELTELVARTQRRELDRDEMRGGTITVTNVGPLGGTAFTPIIRWPEVAIVGLAAARLEPVVRGDLDDHTTEVRLILPLSVAFDHRVNDGADAARFTRDLASALNDPRSLLLSV